MKPRSNHIWIALILYAGGLEVFLLPPDHDTKMDASSVILAFCFFAQHQVVVRRGPGDSDPSSLQPACDLDVDAIVVYRVICIKRASSDPNFKSAE